MDTSPSPSSPDPSSVRSMPGRNAGYVPGQKKARHRRWTRITTGVTLAGLVACVAAGVLVLPKLFDRPSLEANRIAGCREFLAGVASEVRTFAEARGRLPSTLADLRDPELPSAYDAEPWDVWRKAIEYRIVDVARREFELRSLGPDRLPDTPDDIVWPQGARWK